MENKKKQVAIAKIVRPHGLRGDLVALAYTDSFLKYERMQAYLSQDLCFPIVYKKTYKANRFIVRIEGVDSIEKTKQWIGKEIFIDTELLEPLDKEEFYYFEAIGAIVYQNGEKIGQVVEVNNFGSCDVLVVEKDKKRIYLPVLNEYLELFDLENKKIIYHPWYEIE